MKKLLFASTNEVKISEFKKIFNNFEVVSLLDFPEIDEIEETGLTYYENAYIKAKAIWDLFKIPVIADDSGFETEVLFDSKTKVPLPGVFSARYAYLITGNKELDHNYDKNNEILLSEMKNEINRKAKQITVICFLDENGPQYFEGEIHGNVIPKLSNERMYGWGYDKILEINYDNKKVIYGSLVDNVRLSFSQRTIALNKLKKKLLGGL